MNKEDLTQFIEWLPVNINEFKDKTPDEVVTILNKLESVVKYFSCVFHF